ncbi:MAG TPA: ABC transporter permease, partial [Thermoanaerobaculia bacterium]|nr:ABC transporter permease [Thermoanaerobaculia bacterium]
MISDLRQTIRALLRSPGWTLAATSILALGVAANTTVFSWVRSVVLDPIPGASQPARLRVLVARTAAGDVTRMSYPDFRDLAASTPVFDGLIAQRWTGAGFGTPGTGSSQVISCSLVSADYFGVLGVAPTRGRGFRTEEGAGRGSAPVAVVSDALWRRSLRSDPAVVGKTILVNAQPFTVVGVAPPGFYGSLLGIGTDVWIPLVQIGRVDPAADRLENRADRWLLTLARLKPGVDTEQADAALASAQSRLNQT